MGVLAAIIYEKGSLQLLDQLQLPLKTEYMTMSTVEDTWHAIKDMNVRGAPAIAIAAALSLAVDLTNTAPEFATVPDAVKYINDKLDYLVTSRPTAVNLSEATTRLKAVAQQHADAEAAPAALVAAVIAAAEAMLAEDVATNKAIGKHGAEGILRTKPALEKDGVRILTHCNTGTLATAGYGTALGVVRALKERGALRHAYCTETRPYNQGSRLTAFELVADGLAPHTLIADSAAASLMAKGEIDAVVVGADRVAANGDTANKVGTYMLAVAAAHHKVPFFVASPVTTLDVNTESGAAIHIEERSSREVTHVKDVQLAPDGIEVWNPSFDITPGALITGIVTERGVAQPGPSGAFDIPAFLADRKRKAPSS